MEENSCKNCMGITMGAFPWLLDTKYPGDVLALYVFYRYSSMYQNANPIKCSTADAAKKLKWSETKLRRAKQILISLGFVQDVQTKRENGEISGHFIKVM